MFGSRHAGNDSLGRALALLTLTSVLFAACTSSESTEIQSNTPRIRSAAEKLEPGLVSAKALASVEGLGEVQRVPQDDAPLFEDPDPRGPCGTPVEQPDLSEAAVATFATVDLTVFNMLIEVGVEKATGYVDAQLADVRPDCPPYESTTNQGLTQTVTPTVVELPQVGDQRFGGLATIDVADQTLYAGTVLIRRGGLLIVGGIFSSSPIATSALDELSAALDAAAQRLDS